MTAGDATSSEPAGARCRCGAPADVRCEGCGASLCKDHALGPWRPRPAHFRVVSFTDLLRDYPVRHGLGEARFWEVRAALAAACPPGVRCAGCWEAALDAAVAATAPGDQPAAAQPAGQPAGPGEVAHRHGEAPATVPVADLLAAWRRTGKPAVIRDDTVGSSRFRSARGWRVGTLYEDRYARDGEGTVRVQAGPVYLLAGGELWTRGRRLDPAAGWPAAWLPRPPSDPAADLASAGAGSPRQAHDDGSADGHDDGHEDAAAAARAAAVRAARARAEETLRRHGWP